MTRRGLWTLLALLIMVVGAASPGAWLGTADSVTWSEQSARQWAGAYGLDPDWFWSLALCESSGSPTAYNPASGTFGLFQFVPGTYWWLRGQLNADPTLAPHLAAFDPEGRGMDADAGAAEAHVSAWAWAHGYGYLWSCQ